MDLTAVLRIAAAHGCTVETDIPMTPLTSLRVGGSADVLIGAPSAEAVVAVQSACRESGVPLFVMGHGSNLCVGDKGVRGVVLRVGNGEAVLCDDGVTVVCGAGMALPKLSRFALEHGLSGLEFACGIPGSVGGAVYMNAGAYGGQISDVLVSVDIVTADGQVVTWPAAEVELGYRHSRFMREFAVIVSACLRLTPGNAAEMAAHMSSLLCARREKQPLEYPSAGSFFKRPEGYFAGALIEQCGLKGFSVGGAQISEKHAGFLINRGGATAQDVCRLSAEVQARVFSVYGVQLEPEVRFVGQFIE